MFEGTSSGALQFPWKDASRKLFDTPIASYLCLTSGILLYITDFPPPCLSSHCVTGVNVCVSGVIMCYAATSPSLPATLRNGRVEEPRASSTLPVHGQGYVPFHTVVL